MSYFTGKQTCRDVGAGANFQTAVQVCATISLLWQVGILVVFSAKMAISAFHKQLDKVPVFFLSVLITNSIECKLAIVTRTKIEQLS